MCMQHNPSNFQFFERICSLKDQVSYENLLSHYTWPLELKIMYNVYFSDCCGHCQSILLRSTIFQLYQVLVRYIKVASFFIKLLRVQKNISTSFFQFCA